MSLNRKKRNFEAIGNIYKIHNLQMLHQPLELIEQGEKAQTYQLLQVCHILHNLASGQNQKGCPLKSGLYFLSF